VGCPAAKERRVEEKAAKAVRVAKAEKAVRAVRVARVGKAAATMTCPHPLSGRTRSERLVCNRLIDSNHPVKTEKQKQR
jgi:hypothetical protein